MVVTVVMLAETAETLERASSTEATRGITYITPTGNWHNKETRLLCVGPLSDALSY